MNAWCSDIHLNFVRPESLGVFLEKVSKVGNLIITGDISDGIGFYSHLGRIAEACKGTVYFIPGNHDFYHSSFSDIDVRIKFLIRDYPNLVSMNHSGVVRLNDDTCIIGPDSWYDGKVLPSLKNVPLPLNDFHYIHDLNLDHDAAVATFQKKADDGVITLKSLLEEASKTYKKIIILSHPVPFHRMAYNKDEVAPFYTWYEGGAAGFDFAYEHPDIKFLWLSGHTHYGWEMDFLPNLKCVSNSSFYGFPDINKVVNDDLSISRIKL